jgi:hypothetical protein
MDSVGQIFKKIPFSDKPNPLNNHKGKKGFGGEKKEQTRNGSGFPAMIQKFSGNSFHSGI